MPKKQQRSVEISSLISDIILAGKLSVPAMTAGEMASRVGISPETLSRMKRSGRGDIAVINDLAGTVGLKIKLVPKNETKEKMLNGSFLDD